MKYHCIPLKKSPILLLFCFILLLSHNIYSGTTGKIAGKVTDANTGEPLLGANIIIEGTTTGAATDIEGDYFIINVSSGNYTIRASMIGYTAQRVTNVVVNVDRTTTLNFQLQPASIQTDEIVITAQKPVIIRDLTSSITEVSARDIELSPQTNFQNLIRQQRGILLGYAYQGKQGMYNVNTPSDQLHIRGGRENETAFSLNGIVVTDPVWGGEQFIQNSSGKNIDEFNTLAGTYNAEYGNAMSGVINIVTKEAKKDKYEVTLSSYTDRFGIDKYDNNSFQGDIGVGGPVPYTNGNLTFYASGERKATDGYIYGYEYPNWVDSQGQDVDSTTSLPLGSPKKLSMDRQDFWNASFKLNWFVTTGFKVSGFVSNGSFRRDRYDHYFKYHREGLPYHKAEEQFYNLNITHALSNNTYYEIGAARQYHTRFLGVYDNWEKYEQTSEMYDPTGSFFVQGEDWQWQDEDWAVNTARAAIVSQVNKTNLIKIGANFRFLDIHVDSKNPNETGSYYLNYNHKPTEMSAFIQDKMEFSEIGLIINVGARFDSWNPKSPYWTDIIRLNDMKTAEAESKTRFSPRLGVSYPVSDQAAFHFAYGHFYQMPSYYILYQGQRYLTDPRDKSWDRYPDRRGNLYVPFTDDFNFRLANTNMDPEKTVAYEAGVQIKVSEDISLDVTAFYREMTELIGERFIAEANAGTGIRVVDNYDYANSKGVEFVLTKRFSNYFSFRANYTYSQSLVTSSTPWAQLQIQNATYKTFVADWDRPHSVNFDLYIGLPDRWDISFSGNFQSGLPYTIQTEPNTERAPYIGTIDLRFSKTFEVFGIYPQLYLNVLNLADRKNIYAVYPSSGKPDLPLGIPRTAHNLDKYDIPTNYSSGRQIFLGIALAVND